MASKALAWLWVIEALTEVRDADTAVLKALVTRVPDVLKDAPEGVRERIALRYLENFAGKDAAASTSSRAGGGGIDVGLSSEEVLCRHLRKAGTNSEKGGVEPSYDLQQFILHKKAALPKSSLDLLKDLVQEGHGQAVQLLEEQNSLVEPHGVDNLQCIAEHQSAKRLKLSSEEVQKQSQAKTTYVHVPDVRNAASKGSTKDKCVESVRSLEQHNHQARSHQVDNIQCSDFSEYQGAENLNTSPFGTQIQQVDENFPVRIRDTDIVPLREPIQEGHLQAVTSLEDDHSLTRPHQVDNLQPSNFNEHQTGENPRTNASRVESHATGATSSAPAPEVGNADLQDPSKTRLCENNDLQTVATDHEQDILIPNDNVQLLRQNSSPHLVPLSGIPDDANKAVCGKDLVDGEPLMPEAPDDGEGHCAIPKPNVEDPISAGVHQVLGSQISFNNDSLTSDWTEQSLCVKCEKGGQLLICSSCSIAVHETCLGASVNFEETSPFVCPVCAYSRASMAYRKAKRDFSRSKKALSAFIVRDSAQGHQKGRHRTTIMAETSESKLSGDLNDQTDQYEIVACKAKKDCQLAEAVGAVDKDKMSSGNPEVERSSGNDVPCSPVDIDHEIIVNNCERDTELRHHQQTDKVENGDISRVNREGEISNTLQVFGTVEPQHLGETCAVAADMELHHEVEITCEMRNAHDSEKSKGDGKSETDERGLHVEKNTLEQVKSVVDHDGINTTGQVATTVSGSGGHVEKKREDAAIERARRSHRAIKDENRENFSPDNYTRSQVRVKRYSNPILPHGRRTRLHWMAEEEEALKEGVQRFAAEPDRSLPWTKILEFGRHIFHKTRQPGDLKDKWRNIRLKEGSKT